MHMLLPVTNRSSAVGMDQRHPGENSNDCYVPTGGLPPGPPLCNGHTQLRSWLPVQE